MQITFKPIVLDHKRKTDNTYPVKIRLIFKGVVRKIPTTLICNPSDITRGTNRIKNQDILAKAERIISEMRMAIRDISPFELEQRDADWVVARIKEKMRSDTFTLDFFEWGEKYIQSKTPTTRTAYIGALNAFERFLGKREIDINAISRTLILEFMDHVDAEPKIHFDVKTRTYVETDKEKISKGASTRHIMKLSNIFQAAKDRYNDEDSGIILIPKSPFNNLPKVFPPSDGQTSLGVETMQKIILAQTDNELIRIALDVFVLSFGLMGANLADLYSATPVKDLWIYNRQKTRSRRADKAEMRIKIPAVLHPFISRLQDGSDGWWLPVLHNMASNKDFATQRVNRALRKWCEENDLPVFTFYAARHSFATIARGKAGIEKSLLDEMLCHVGDYKMTDIYAERDWDLINAANEKLLALFTWE